MVVRYYIGINKREKPLTTKGEIMDKKTRNAKIKRIDKAISTIDEVLYDICNGTTGRAYYLDQRNDLRTARKALHSSMKILRMKGE